MENTTNNAAQTAAQQAAQNAANAQQNAQAQAPQQPAQPQKGEKSSHLGWLVAGGIVVALGVTAVISYRKGRNAGREEEKYRRDADADAVAGAISAGLSASERYNSTSNANTERGVNSNRR